jgi:uncharacterized phage protein (TIGR01671 family)
MRTIIFRGFSNDPYTDWVQGDLIHLIDGTPIIRHDMRTMTVKGVERIVWQENKVVQKSIGQFTGLCDRFNHQIFEGDILQCTDDKGKAYRREVVYIEGAFCQKINIGTLKKAYNPLRNHDLKLWAIVGNVYENPELLEGTAQ